jgi:hypothetical protein
MRGDEGNEGMTVTVQAKRLYISIAAALAVVCVGYLWLNTKAATIATDEIHYSYLENEDGVVFNWRGYADTIYYAPEGEYGQPGREPYSGQAKAAESTVKPVDTPGPFMEVTLAGLQRNTTYHYKIGIDGVDRTFRTVPTASFTWVDIGDTASSLCNSWMPTQHQLITVQNPSFVTHGGDISEANNCSAKATHSYYSDQEVWSRSAAFQPVWGNHEYANPTAKAAAGTPRDSMANYKGRSYMTNAQTVAIDTPKRVTHPGCGSESGSTVNTCQGEDWGWFKTGHVLFISYPEADSAAYPEWQIKADALMAQAQANPEIDYIITYGHRPAYTSVAVGPEMPLQAAVNALATKYSPRANNLTGKYVLNIGHHAHGEEAFAPINGLVHINNAAGGQGLTSFGDPAAAGSIFRMRHFGILRGDYDATNHSLAVRIICGAEFTTIKDACTYGNTMYGVTFTKSSVSTPAPSAQPLTIKEWITNAGVETDAVGWAGRYGSSPYVAVARVTGMAHTGTSSLRVSAVTGAKALSSGFNDNPRWQTNTIAGKMYTASVWVKPTFTGQKLTLRLREWKGTSSANDKAATITATATDWQKITVPLIATASGNQLAVAVYGNAMSAGQSFFADDISLTSTN